MRKTLVARSCPDEASASPRQFQQRARQRHTIRAKVSPSLKEVAGGRWENDVPLLDELGEKGGRSGVLLTDLPMTVLRGGEY